jgi:hypothetical protein
VTRAELRQVAQGHYQGQAGKILKEATATQEMYLIEVIIPRDDCSRSLHCMAGKLGELRDAAKCG